MAERTKAAPRPAILNTAPPRKARRNGGAQAPSAPMDDADVGPPGEPLPKLVPLKRVKGECANGACRLGAEKDRHPPARRWGPRQVDTVQQLQSSWATCLPWVGLPIEECASLGVYTEDEDQDVDMRQDIIDAAYGLDCVATGKQHMLAMAGEDSEMIVFDRAGGPNPNEVLSADLRAAMDYHVGALALDVAVDLYGGNEIARRQVRAFMRAVVKLARMINGPVVMTGHVSQAGIQSDGGHPEARTGRTPFVAAPISARRRTKATARSTPTRASSPARRRTTRASGKWSRCGGRKAFSFRKQSRGPIPATGRRCLPRAARRLTSEGQKVSPKPRAGKLCARPSS